MKKLLLILLVCLLLLSPGGHSHAQANVVRTNKAGVEFESALAPVSAVHLVDLNPGWVRFHIKWDLVETAPGEYDWTSREAQRVERILHAARRVGATPFLTVKLAPEFYRTLPDRCSRPDAPDGAAALGNFILALAERYAGLQYFELWNEPDVPVGIEHQDFLGCFIEADGDAAAGRYYGGLMKAVAAVVKAHRSDLKLAGPSLLGNRQFLNYALAAGRNSFDIVSIHHYQGYYGTVGQQYDIRRLEGLYKEVRYYQQQHNLSLPIIISETSLRCALAEAWNGNTHRCKDFPDFYQQQGEWLAALDAWAQSKPDVPTYIWYTAQRNGWDDTDLVYRNNRKKPVFIEFMHLTQPFRPAPPTPTFQLHRSMRH